MKPVFIMLAAAMFVLLPSAVIDAQQIERKANFGDLHVHTSWSFDAYIAGVLTNPRDAYRYGLGEEIPLYTVDKQRRSTGHLISWRSPTTPSSWV